jgi:ribosomal protein L32
MSDSANSSSGGTTPFNLVSCPECGKLQLRTQRVCSSCGTRLPTMPHVPPTNRFRELAIRFTIGIVGLATGPVLLYLIPYWAGFLFLGVFSTVLGFPVGVMFLFFGGTIPGVHRNVWTLNKATQGGWLQYGGPAAAAGLQAQAETHNDENRRDEPD